MRPTPTRMRLRPSRAAMVVRRFVRAYVFHRGVLEGVPGLFIAATGGAP